MGHRVQTFRNSKFCPLSSILCLLLACPELVEGLPAILLLSPNLHVFPQWPLEAETSQFFLQSSINIHV